MVFLGRYYLGKLKVIGRKEGWGWILGNINIWGLWRGRWGEFRKGERFREWELD